MTCRTGSTYALEIGLRPIRGRPLGQERQARLRIENRPHCFHAIFPTAEGRTICTLPYRVVCHDNCAFGPLFLLSSQLKRPLPALRSRLNPKWTLRRRGRIEAKEPLAAILLISSET